MQSAHCIRENRPPAAPPSKAVGKSCPPAPLRLRPPCHSSLITFHSKSNQIQPAIKANPGANPTKSNRQSNQIQPAIQPNPTGNPTKSRRSSKQIQPNPSKSKQIQPLNFLRAIFQLSSALSPVRLAPTLREPQVIPSLPSLPSVSHLVPHKVNRMAEMPIVPCQLCLNRKSRSSCPPPFFPPLPPLPPVNHPVPHEPTATRISKPDTTGAAWFTILASRPSCSSCLLAFFSSLQRLPVRLGTLSVRAFRPPLSSLRCLRYLL